MSLEVTPDEIEQWLNNGINKTLRHAPEDVCEPVPIDEQRECKLVNDTIMTNYDFKALAEKFKSDEATIQATIEKMEAEFRAEIPGETDAMYKHFVMHDLGKNMAGGDAKSKADEFNGVILAVSRAKDLNDYPKRLCWKEYAADPKGAVKAGYIKEEFDEKGNVVKKIPLETTETINGKPNPKFGQPIEYRRAREMIMVLLGNQKIDGVEVPGNGEIVLVRANLDNVNIGCKSTVYGKKSNPVKDKPYTSVVRGWSDFYDENGAYSNTWAIADKVFETFYTEIRSRDEFGTTTATRVKKLSLAQVAELPSFGYFITRGFVQGIKKSDDGTKVYLAVEDSDGNRLRLSTNYEPLINIVEDLCEGDDVILTGERSSFKNESDEWVNYNMLMGVVKNPGNNEVADGLKRLAEVRKNKKT